MLKADNNNNYDYDQASGEKHTGQKQYIILRTEIWIRSLVRNLDQRSGSSQRSDNQKVDVGR